MLTRDELLRYSRVTVMGLGLFGGGAGAARYFAQLGAKVTVTDMAGADKLAKSIATLDGLDIDFVLGEHRPKDFTAADLVVANQAVRPDNPYLAAAREAGVPIATETGLALALNRSPWAAVSGSSGKSTTTALLAAMLERHDPATLLGGNIGGDLLTRVEARPENSPLVVELSSFQLTYLAAELASGAIAPPKVAVVTNLSPNHLDWHRDMEEYVEAKRNLIRYQTPNDWAILNADDPRLAAWIDAGVPARLLSCAMADPLTDDACYVEQGEVRLRIGGDDILRLPLRTFRLLGRHNIYNSMQAVAATYAMCRDADAVRVGFATFQGLPHRLEKVCEAGGRLFVNDSKSTTPEAAITALAAIEEPKVLIAGGHDKLSPFEALGVAIQERAAGLVLVGRAGARLAEAVRMAADKRPAGLGELHVVDAGDDFTLAMETALSMTPPGGVVLLSPACASYGMFTNYEERGRVFRELSERLGRKC